jgi:large subunit ribosomal protein L16
VAYWVSIVRPGKILFEIAGIRKERVYQSIRVAASKLPGRVQFVEKA